MFIKKIFQNKIDESVHKQFTRFGRGKFDERAIINIKKGPKIKISTSFELDNDLVFFVASLYDKFKVKGILLSKQEIPEFEGKKKKGVFNYDVNKEMSSEELKNFASKYYHTLFDCISEDGSIELKIKKKLPKPGKGKTKVNDKFCHLVLDQKYWPAVKEEFLFDLPPKEIKKVHIEHTYIIKDIKIPKELEKEKDFEKIRLEARRVGRIIRKINIDKDKKEIIKEKEFIA